MKNTLFKGRHHGSNLKNLNGVSTRLTEIKKCLLIVFTLGCAIVSGSASASLFTVDGIDSPGDNYSDSFTLDTILSSGGTASLNVSLGRGDMDSQTDHLFMLLEMPTDILDLTFGVNTSPGWNGRTAVTEHQEGAPKGENHGIFDGVKGVHPIGSEYIKFNLDGDEVKVKMGFKDGNGYNLDKDGDGMVKGASTSLDYNLKNNYLSDEKSAWNQDSPGGAACKANPGSDADCYASIALENSDYQYVQSYELEIDILAIDANFFSLGYELTNVQSFLTTVSAHASVPKDCTKNVTFNFGATPGTSTNCDETTRPPEPVPEPSAIFLFGIGLAGLGFSFSRRNAKA